MTGNDLFSLIIHDNYKIRTVHDTDLKFGSIRAYSARMSSNESILIMHVIISLIIHDNYKILMVHNTNFKLGMVSTYCARISPNISNLIIYVIISLIIHDNYKILMKAMWTSYLVEVILFGINRLL